MIRIKYTEKYKSLNPLEIELAEFSILTGINGCGKSQFLELVERKKLPIMTIEIFNKIKGEYEELENITVKRIEFDGFIPSNLSEATAAEFSALIPSIMELIHQPNSFNYQRNGLDNNKDVKIALDNLCENLGKSEITEISDEDLSNNIAYFSQITGAKTTDKNGNSKPTQFGSDLSRTFMAYKAKLDNNYRNRGLGVKFLSENEFEGKYGEKPWETVNKYIESFGLNYEVTHPNPEADIHSKFCCRLINKPTQDVVAINQLSSGEKVFLMFIGAWFNYQSDAHKTDILLLDEPDATLHPEMISKLFQFIKEHIVTKGTHVIMTSHTPTTVALSEIDTVYEVNNKNEDPKEIVKKIKKEDALNNLLRGIPYIQLRDRSIKQVFVEDEMDAYYYQEIFKCLQLNGKIRHDVSLIFLSAGIVGTGGCDKVRELTMKLRAAGNNSVYGIIDWDGSQSDREFVYVVGKGQRYSLENYIFDPIVLASTLIVNLKRSDFFEKHLTKYKSYGYQKISEFEDKQLNELTKIVLMALDFEYGGDETLVQYLSGKSLSIPTRFLLEIGHDLKDRIEKKIPELKQFANGYRNKSLAIDQAIIDKTLIPNMSDFISQDVLDVFNKIIEN